MRNYLFKILLISALAVSYATAGPATFTPTLRQNTTVDLSWPQIDANFSNIATVANAANVKLTSVLDLGAVCDGITDDSAAINSGLISLAHGAAYIPTGVTCAINSPITLTNSGVSLISDKGIIKKLGNFDAIIASSFYSLVRGVIIDGNHFNGNGITVTGYRNSIEDNTISNNNGYGIYFNGSSTPCYQNVLSRNKIGGSTLAAVAINNCDADRIVDNNIHDNNHEGLLISNQSVRTIVNGNTFIANGLSGGLGAITIDYSTYINITGNIIKGTLSSLPAIKTVNTLGSSKGLIISSNIFNNNAGGGVRLFTNGSNINTNCLITSNVFDSVGTNAIVVDASSNLNTLLGNSLNGGVIVNAGTNTINTANQ